MRIRLPKDSPFWTSFVFHGIALLLLFVFVMVDWIRPQKKVHVFEMISLPDTAAVQNPVVTEASKPERQSRLLPDPEPEPETKSKPKPRPKAPPKLIKYSDFIKKNPIKDPKPQKTTPVRPISTPAISVPKIVLPNTTETPASEQLSSTQLNELAQYNARLRARLDAAWKKPVNYGGIALTLTVQFKVAANGQISEVRLAPASANTGFNQSVLAAFRAMGSGGATPTGRAHTFSLEFSLK